MKSSKKLLSVILCMLMLLSNAIAFADNGDVVNKADFSLYATAEEAAFNIDGKGTQITFNGSQYYYEYNEKYYNIADVFTAYNNDKTEEKTNFLNDLESNYSSVEKPGTGELRVEEVSAINKTNIVVKLSKAAEKELTKDFFKVEGATVTTVAPGEKADEYILNIESLDGKKGTVTVNGVSKTYDFTAPVVEKAEVENVELVNYRRMTVTFNTVVDKASAENPANYYFELVEGKAGKFGATAGEVVDSYSLNNITGNGTDGITKWWEAKDANDEKININAQPVEGKTVVTINFPEDARFGKGAASITLKALAGKSGADKALDKDVKFLFAVRDVKDAKKLRTIDTAVKEITVKDEIAPKLVKATVVHSDNTIEKVDLSKPVEVKVDDKIVLEFSEPLEKHDEAGKKVKVYRDGKELNTTTNTVGANAIAIEKVATTTYDDAKLATIDLGSTNGFLEGLTPTKGDKFVVLVTGLRDLAGNLAGDVKFTIEVVEDKTTPDEDLKILGVEQVLDNVFRIEANKAAKDLAANLVIKEADKDNKDVKVEFKDTSLLEFKKCEFDKNGVDVELSGKPVVTKKYYAYVAVPAAYKATEVNQLDFEGGFYLDKKVIVESTDKKFETYIKDNMHIELDRQAPELDQEEQEIPYAYIRYFHDATDLKLNIGFTDVNPKSWNKEYNSKEIVAAQEAIFANLATGYTGTVRVKATYINDNEDEVTRYVDLDYNGKTTTTNKAYIDEDKNVLVLNLKDSNLLVKNDGTEITALTDLESGVKFEISLPKGVASDDYAKKANVGITGGTFLDESGREENKHGYTSVASDVVITIGEKQKVVEGKKVPQTSKQLIGYDPATKELVILVTGLPTRESVENLDNYILNGKTLKELGAKESDVFFADAQAKDLTAVSVTGDLKDYKVIRITLPKNSIEKNGPADLIVRGLAHKEGATMTEVETVVEGLEDNTAPGFVSGKIEGNSKITLKFDEPVVLAKDALSTSAIRNFTVKINGETVQVLTATPSGNTITLEIANDNTVIEKAEIEIKLNPNGKMEIVDETGNELDVTEEPIVILK